MSDFRRTSVRAAWAAALALAGAACGGSAPGSGTPAASTAALAAALASSSTSGGTLLCAPTAAQVGACAGAAIGDPCTLTSTDDGTVSGVCRATLDGKAVACAPRPPAPPAGLVAACSGKAAGDACHAAEPFGDTHDGVCATAPDGATLVCGRDRMPPAGAVAACAGASAGDACSLPAPDPTAAATNAKGTTGVCSFGPAGTGALACSPAQDLLPRGADACAGLAARAACTLGRDDDAVTGTCVVPAEGGAGVCVVACGDVGGPFDRRDGGMEPEPASTTTPPAWTDPGTAPSMSPAPSAPMP